MSSAYIQMFKSSGCIQFIAYFKHTSDSQPLCSAYIQNNSSKRSIQE